MMSSMGYNLLIAEMMEWPLHDVIAEMEKSRFCWNVHHWLQQKLSFWQLPMYPGMKIWQNHIISILILWYIILMSCLTSCHHDGCRCPITNKCGAVWCQVIHNYFFDSTHDDHQMETFIALLALCVGNSLVTGEFPSQRPVKWSSDVFFDLHLNKRLSKQSIPWRFEMPSCSLWCHCNVLAYESHLIHALMQDCTYSIANAVELLQSYTKPSICPVVCALLCTEFRCFHPHKNIFQNLSSPIFEWLSPAQNGGEYAVVTSITAS